MSALKSLIGKPAISAGISAVALPYVSGGTEFLYQGQRYPLWALGAGLGAGSSFVSELAHNYILPHIPGNVKYAHLESMVLSVAASGGAFVLGAKIINSNLNMDESRKFFMVGALTEITSSYLASNFLDQPTL